MSKIPVLHQTDLYHPPVDPDDHWDLSCQFALARIDPVFTFAPIEAIEMKKE